MTDPKTNERPEMQRLVRMLQAHAARNLSVRKWLFAKTDKPLDERLASLALELVADVQRLEERATRAEGKVRRARGMFGAPV